MPDLEAILTSAACLGAMRGLMFKKDCELPWPTRILRWWLFAMLALYVSGFVANSYVKWFF